MANPYFQFKRFTVYHDQCAMKVTTDACLFGAWVAKRMEQINEVRHALDIGAGSGLLSLMVAQKSKIAITSVEIEPSAATQAKANVQQSPFSHQIEVIQGDVREINLPLFDCIFSNPPFYEKEIRSTHTGKNIAHHSDSLKINEVIDLIDEKLKPEGKCYLLLPSKRWPEIKSMMIDKFFLHEICTVRQTPLHPPFRVMITAEKRDSLENEARLTPGSNPQNPRPTHSNTEILIKTLHDQYSPEFVELLKDYYLYL